MAQIASMGSALPTGQTPYSLVKNLIKRLVDGVHNKDAVQVASCFHPESILFTLAPPLQHSPEDSASKKGLENWFNSFSGPIDVEVRDLKIFIEDDIAFSHSINRMTGRKLTGQNVDLWYRESLGFVLEDGVWRIVHQHQSVPLYMDGSYKAAVDLRP